MFILGIILIILGVVTALFCILFLWFMLESHLPPHMLMNEMLVLTAAVTLVAIFFAVGTVFLHK